MSLGDLFFLSAKCEELEVEIEKQSKIIEALKKSNDFYANKSNWRSEGSSYRDTFIFRDCEPDYDDNCYAGVCGKLAREIKKQIEELEK